MSSAPTAADRPAGAERLRHFCRALLAALDSAPPGCLPALPEELLRALGAGVGEVADGLRREAEAWEAAAHSLRSLPGRYLSAAAVGSAVAELDAARSVALQVAGALECLRGDPADPAPAQPAPPAPALMWVPPPANPRVAEPVQVPAPEPATPAQGAARTDDTAELQLTITGRETEQAAALFREAEGCRRRRELERAEALYTEAVRVDPRFGPAYSRRGQVRAARGDLDLALADFDAALGLDEGATEAWWWRADAHAMAGRLTEAVADYRRALALRPELARARFRLAVVLQRMGEADRALEELDGVIEARPTYAAAYLNRGQLRLQVGDRRRAADDFRAALRHDPACAPAREQLAALAAAADDEPDGTLSLAPDPEPGTEAAPAPKPAAKPERPQPGQVAIKCPGCGAPGAVPWDRLGKVLVCGACKRQFGVTADGAATELVCTPDGKWVELPQLREKARRRRKQRLMLAAAVLGAVLLPVGALGGWKAVRREEPAPAERELPRELNARADLFAQAWLCNDVRLMRRLTPPAQDKGVYAWYNRHRPPAALRTQAGGTPPDGARVEISSLPARPGQAVLRVRISNPALAPNHPPVEMTWVWQEQGDSWYFVPPTK